MKPRVWLAFWSEAHITVSCPVFHPQVLLHRAAPNLLISQSVQILGKAMMQVQARTIYLASTNFIRFIWAHFSRLKSFWVTSIPTWTSTALAQCGVICKLPEGILKSTARHWWYRSHYGPLRDSIYFWSPFGHWVVDCKSLDAAA